jgi:SMI1-KNR4 cell-wall
MKIDITNFWSADNDDKPVLTQAMVAFAEKSLNVKLPQMLINLLMIQNGGYTNGFAFPMMQQTSWSANHIPLFELFGIITEKSIEDWKNSWDEERLINFYVEDKSIEIVQNILDTHYMTKEWGLPEKQVLLTGEGHWWITLDYRKSDVPSVRWIDVECDEDLHVANSFEEFINGLVPQDEYAYDEE